MFEISILADLAGNRIGGGGNLWWGIRRTKLLLPEQVNSAK